MMQSFFNKTTYFMPIIIEKNTASYGVISEKDNHQPDLIFFQTFPLDAHQLVNGKIMNQYFFVHNAQKIATAMKLGHYFTALACPIDEKNNHSELFSHILFLITLGMPCTYLTSTEKLYENVITEKPYPQVTIKNALLKLYQSAQREL